MVEWSKKIYDRNFGDEGDHGQPWLSEQVDRRRRHGHTLCLRDLNTIPVEEIPAHDILTGGFPCQPFSIAGRQEGFEDERSNVFWKILEIISHHQPQVVVLENVKNLISHDEGNTFRVIRSELEARGYHICYKVLNTSDITGVPQHRERIYIVCFKSRDLYDRFSLEFAPVPKRGVREMLEAEVDPKYYCKPSSAIYPMLSAEVRRKDTVYQYRRVYVRENKSNECPTLTANMGGGGHNVPFVMDDVSCDQSARSARTDKGIRKLTPRECFNFQGFPSTYQVETSGLSDTNLYKLAGNAVSVPVVKLIADRLLSLLKES